MHTWKFYRKGGLDQVLIESGADIAHLDELDQKLWTALSCPTTGIRFDAKTLELLDTDKDGRIRVPELLAAVRWLSARLVSLDTLLEGSETLRLSAINAATPEGAALLTSAKRILENAGKAQAEAVSLADIADAAKIFAATRFNGDGVVTPESADDEATRRVIVEIIATVGAVEDRSGKAGVSQAKADAFFGAVEAHLAWVRRADATILPFGDRTAAASAAVNAVRGKIDDFFTRCRLAAFDNRATGALSRTDADFAALAALDLTDGLPALAAFPLSKVEPGRDLPLTDGLNPYWADAMSVFRKDAVVPCFGEACARLSLAQWLELKAKLAPYDAWMAAKAGAEVEKLGLERLAVLASGNDKENVSALIAKDTEFEAESDRIADIEKLLRLNANLYALLNNYVNMARLYDPNSCAIFRMGTLYLDGRAISLCFHVDDIGAHSAQAAASKCCLAYCALSRSGKKESRMICAAVTAGFANTLWVGRNGIFYDLDGKDWDAVVVKLVDHSISLKEAFWDPWRKIAGMVGGQVRKLLAAKQEGALAGASKRIDAVGSTPTEAPKKMEGAALASSVAALGIAVGLIGSAVGGLVSMLAGLPLWKTLLGVILLVLLVSGPSVLLTWFKLRSRDIAPILNACGWAVNRNIRLTLKLGRLFTSEAALPPNAQRRLTDPYADDHTVRNTLLAVLALLALAAALWFAGLLDSVCPDSLKRRPAAHAPAESVKETAPANSGVAKSG